MNSKKTVPEDLAGILDGAGVFAVLDEFGNYRYVNRKWEEITGIPSKDAVGKNVETLLEGSGAMLSLRTGRPITGETFMRSRAGKDISAIMKYRPVLDKDSNVTGCIATSLFDSLEEAKNFSASLDSMLEEFDYLKENPYAGGNAKYTTESIIGDSKAIRSLKEQIYIAGATNSSCLIEGETGTGKELVAHAIHNASLRNAFPFVRVNCSAIPENLMESEFFGYEEGSFTGGLKGGRAGKFEKAHLGSMFLDEINAMSLSMQPKLLRALQEKEIERIGGVKSIPVDVRIIAAANVPLKKLAQQGIFRQDLYYRLNIMNIKIPPLRERKEDIPQLVESFIVKYNSETMRNVRGISGDGMDYLMSYDWPGNVRELQNVIERTMASTWSDILEPEHFKKFNPDYNAFGSHSEDSAVSDEGEMAESSVSGGSAAYLPDIGSFSLGKQKELSEVAVIKKALEVSGGNKAKAARMMNISRTMLYKKLEKYKITC